MPLKPKHFIINTGALKQDVFVCINYRSTDVNRMLKRYIGTEQLAKNQSEALDEKKTSTALFLYNFKSNHRIIALFPDNWSQAICLFDHEKMHALCHVMEHVGIKLNTASEEIWAYTSEWMMSQFLKQA